MTDPPRLKIASNQTACRLLLESALEDHSAPGAADRALRALNLGAGAAGSAAAAHAASSSSAGTHVASSVVLKWLGLGLLGGAVTLVSAEQAVRRFSESRSAPVASGRSRGGANTQRRADPVVAAPRPGVADSEAESSRAPAERKAQALSARAPAGPPLAAAPASEPAPDPVQDLRTIREALAAHAEARALALLDVFVIRYPSSTLLEEAAVLRFDALIALGRSQARAVGEDFLRRYPRSAYATRVSLELSRLP